MVDQLEFMGPYKDVCSQRPHLYSFYNKYSINWAELEGYQVV